VARHERADRILDAAGELMLRLGYRKVTIEDVAQRARVGKGTVYLHWPTKERLFEALLMRESIELHDELADALRADVREVLPHRFVRWSFLAAQRRQLVRAVFIGDVELLGSLRESSIRSQKMLANEHYFQLMTQHGLLRNDFPNLAYAMEATISGFFLTDADNPEPDLDAKANAMARTIRTSFEPPDEPDPATLRLISDQLIALFTDLSSTYRKCIYGEAG
jgi:AcrR family transcriptional regulator